MRDGESDATGELTIFRLQNFECVHGFEATVKRQGHFATEYLVSTADQAIREVGFALFEILECRFNRWLIFDTKLSGKQDGLDGVNYFLFGMVID